MASVEAERRAMTASEGSHRRDANPLIPDGIYAVAVVSVEIFLRYGEQRWCVYCVVLAPSEFEGVELPLFLNPPRGKRLSPASKLAETWVIATGSRPPSDLAERDPGVWLEGEFEAEVATVTENEKNEKRRAELAYSKVARLLKRIAR